MGDCRGDSDDSRYWGTVPPATSWARSTSSSGAMRIPGSTGSSAGRRATAGRPRPGPEPTSAEPHRPTAMAAGYHGRRPRRRYIERACIDACRRESRPWPAARPRPRRPSMLPDGVPAPGHHHYRVVDDDGVTVGSLWIGPHAPEQPEAYWVWNVEIDEAHRGRGFGRAAMVLAEHEARAHGATDIGLNVFGPTPWPGTSIRRWATRTPRSPCANRCAESLGERYSVHLPQFVDLVGQGGAVHRSPLATAWIC